MTEHGYYWSQPPSGPSDAAAGQTQVPQQHYFRSPLSHLIGARWQWMITLSLITFFATYFLAVRTYLGQYLENAALLGAQQETPVEVTNALSSLNSITVTSLAIAVIVVVVIGVIRQSWRLAVSGGLVIILSAGTTEVLKQYVLPRPDLADIYVQNGTSSFPSGHSAIAMSILIALLIVIPYRWRGLTMLIMVTWALGIGEATVTARWHRLSDTLGADMIVLMIGAGVALWLLDRGLIQPDRGRAHVIRVILVIFMSVVAVLALATGLILTIFTVGDAGLITSLMDSAEAGNAPNLTAHLDPAFNYNMFLAAQSLALAFSTFSVLWFWSTFHRLETVGR